MRLAAGRRVVRAVFGLTVLALLVASGPMRTKAQSPPDPAERWDGLIERLSVPDSWYGENVRNPRMSRHTISGDGRYVLFTTELPNDPGPPTVFNYRRDRQEGTTNDVGPGMVNAPPVISSDGNHRAVEVCGWEYHPDGSQVCDILAIDDVTYRYANMSTALDGTISADHSSEPVLSRSGRFVVFRTNSPTLLPPGAAPGQLVLRDRDADGNGVLDEPGGATVRVVSVSSAGEPGNLESASAEVSADGRFVAFRSRASNLVANDTNGAWDVFLHDTATGETRRINVGWDGQEATPTVDSPAISMSEDGRFVAFAADDSYLTNPPAPVPDDNNALDVYVFDRVENTLTRVDVGAGGTVGNGHTHWPSLSADGRYVALASMATNVAAPGTPGRSHVFVYDRATAETTRVSVNPDGTEPDRDCTHPTISADGSVVTFVSQATNLPTGAPAGTDTIYAAVHFEVTPAALTLPARGGEVWADVTAQRYVRWEARLEWTWLESGPTPFWGVGSGRMSFRAARNPNPAPRSTTVTVHAETIEVTQEAGLSLTGISPAQGPASGGTQVTLSGTGFEPGMFIYWENLPDASPVEFVDTTTARTITPPHAAGDAFFWLNTTDGAGAMSPQLFHFSDVTPPEIQPWVDGQQTPDGWYTSNVQVLFAVFDPDSEISSRSDDCTPPPLQGDTAGTTYTCTATSEGGTSSASVVVRRDGTGPDIDIVSPAQTIYKVGDPAPLANFACTDPLTGVAECQGIVPRDQAVDMAPGYHDFWVTARDGAGNSSGRVITYAVTSGGCAARPDAVSAYFPFESEYLDVITQSTATAVGMQFVDGITGRWAVSGAVPNAYISAGTPPSLGGPLTLAAWIKPGDPTGAFEVIAGSEGEFMLAVAPDGTLHWALATANRAWGWVPTSARLQRHVWAHVALTYDGTQVAVFLNGLSRESWWTPGPRLDANTDLNDFRIAAREDPLAPSPFSGAIDDLLVASRALAAAEIQSIALAASDGLCGARPTTITVTPDPVTVSYGATQPQVFTVTVSSDAGPVPGRRFLFFDPTGYLLVLAETGANGQAQIGASVTGTAIGTHPGFEARFEGDFQYAPSTGSNVVNVERAVPAITWPAPTAIVYGTPLGAQQLNATANVLGTFAYAPPGGYLFGAGTHTLSAEFVPTDTVNYQTTTATTSLTVTRATPVVTVTGGTFPYDGLPHAATGTVTGALGEALGAPTFTYDGSPNPPVSIGTYTVVAHYPGDTNHGPATATTTLEIGDGTPPVILPSATGTLGANGWYTSDVVVGFTTSDPESSITSTAGCATVNVTVDTAGTTFTCTATSEGGTASASIAIRRDTTAPAVAIVSPAATLYAAGAIVVPDFTCTDVTSGTGACTGSTNGEPVDTLTAGYHTFSVTATDQAGNTRTTSVEYAVGSNVCAYPLPGLRGWWRFEGDTGNWMITGNRSNRIGFTSDVFVPGPVGQAYQFEGPNGFIATEFSPTWWSDEKFAMVAWVNPSANTVGTILRSHEGYALARLQNGSIGWAFRKFDVPGLAYVDTGVKLPLNVWSHVVVDLDDTVVRTYLNGRLVHTATGIGDVYNLAFRRGITLGGADDRAEYFRGALDDVMVFDHGLDAGRVEQLYLAGAAGACVHKRTSLQIAEPVQAYFGDSTYAIDVRVVDENGAPVVGRTVNLESQVSAWPHVATYKDLVTDADGRVHWDAPLRNAPRGLYEQYLYLRFTGDTDYTWTSAAPDVVVNKGRPVIAWSPPAAITYGTPLSATQLNATASVAGAFSYSPAAGATLPAGAHTLTTTFTPTNTYDYETATASVPLTVNTAAATVVVTGGTFTYDGTPHAAPASVTGVGGLALGPLTVTYNGSADVPVNAGTYDVVASFAGDANHEPASASATLTIGKAAASVTANGGTFIYDGAPHAATGTVTGVGGVTLGPLTFTYDGSADPPVNAGTYDVIASFAGDANHEAATATTTLTIGKAAATVTASGGTYTYDGAPHAATGTVTGVDGITLGPLTFTYNGSADVPVNAGTYAVVASFAGDANHEPASAGTSITIQKANAVVQWAQPGAITYGTPLGAAQLNASANAPGTFVYSPAAGAVLNAGAGHPLSVTFTPADAANYVGASAATTIDVTPAPLTVRATDAVKRFGAPLPALGATTAGFVNGDTAASLGGTLALTTTATEQSPVGVYPIVPSGVTSPNYTIAFMSGTLAVVKGAVDVSVAASPEPSGAEQPMTFTAAVAAAAPAVGSPTGTVRFFDGLTLLGSAAIANGTASLSTAGLDAGTRTIEARYDGDASFEAGSGSAAHVILDGSQTPAVALASSRNPSNLGQSVTFTATLSMAAGPVTGTVEFYSGGTLLAASLVSGGRAAFTTSSLAAGSHAITAKYLGAGGVPPSRSDVLVQAVGAAGWKDRATSIVLTATPDPAALGDTIALTAEVTGSSGSAPTGAILFMVDGKVIAEVAVGPAGGTTARATLDVAGLAHGRHDVSATYLGDPMYKGATTRVTVAID